MRETRRFACWSRSPVLGLPVRSPTGGTLATSADGRWLALIDRLNDSADWTDLYEYAPVSMFGVADGTAYVRGLDERVTFDLAPPPRWSRPTASGSPTTPVPLTCTVPTGECTVMEGTEEGVDLPADRPFGLPRESSIDPG